jgi:hypothetical protein
MKEIVVVLHGGASNNAVITMPGRRYPGVVIQGDTLRNLLEMSETVVRCSQNSNDNQLREEASALYEGLLDIYNWYEREAPPLD